MFPQQVLDDINRGNAYLSQLNADYIEKPCGNCSCKCNVKNCLVRILSALDYKASVGDYDSISETLYDKMIFIIGDYIVQLVTVQWGYYNSEPNTSTITFQFESQFPTGSHQFNLNFGSQVISSDKWIAFSQPSTEPVKTKWFNTTLNSGTIPDSALKPPIIIGGRSIVVSRSIFVFEDTNTSLKIST